jgi:hypothetical protein
VTLTKDKKKRGTTPKEKIGAGSLSMRSLWFLTQYSKESIPGPEVRSFWDHFERACTPIRPKQSKGSTHIWNTIVCDKSLQCYLVLSMQNYRLMIDDINI